MKRTNKHDEFFDLQPPLEFVNYLREPVHTVKPEGFGERALRLGEADAHGIYLDAAFPDESSLLETAYADFAVFLRVYELAGQRYPIRLVMGETRCFEAYEIDVRASECIITANDTEGIRRALIFIEDELRSREGGFLPIGKVERWPHIRARITRGFFSPTNRPPKWGDELSDDIDYYPEEYLNRLAHDGTNGLWIYTSFKALLPSGYIPEYGVGYEKRIAKLNRVIASCARYGIGVYVFAIEPHSFGDKAMVEKYADSLGTGGWDNQRAICTHSELGKKYSLEATQRMFELLPDLKGYINITMGERVTSCASVRTNDCPRCAAYTKPEVLAYTVDLFREGIRRVKPEADYVSWTYGHRGSSEDDIREYVKKAPDDVMLMQNFEDRAYVEQLGKTRIAIDYWLSYPGPSQMFEATAEQAIASGKHLWAKMQICNSHEIASVPYIPAPGLVFTKFKEAHRLKVEGVVECWYFGNYPCIMSKAAGELAFMHDFTDKQEFLRNLAAKYWGESKAAVIADAWKKFEEGYANYPINVMFSYYGPMHDGVVWELALKPKNFSLPRTWMLTDRTDGDRISESLFYGHTLDEAIELSGYMHRDWREGMECLGDLLDADNEQITVIKALEILFKSGLNILRFYKLRDMLGKQQGDARGILNQMLELVRDEIANSEKMIPLCEKDGRLGYHSEAEGYKFFPDKLRHRITTLKTLMDTEFPEVSDRLDAGLPPLEYYLGIEADTKSYKITNSLEDAKWELFSDGVSKFRAAYDKDYVYYEFFSPRTTEFVVVNEFEMLWPSPIAVIDGNGKVRLCDECYAQQSIFRDGDKQELEKWKVEALAGEGTHIKTVIKREDFGWTSDTPYKLSVRTWDGAAWCVEDEPVITLGKSNISPGQFGWMIH